MKAVAEPARPSDAASDLPSSLPIASELKVSPYERAASTIYAILILVGGAVLMLFLLWMTWRLSTIRVSAPIELVEETSGGGDKALGAENPLPPGAEEAEELAEPQVEQTVEAVTHAVSSLSGVIGITTSGTQATRKGGPGPSRRAGPPDDGPNTRPRSERWRIEYPPGQTARQYAAILDQFKIELGAVGGNFEEVDYAFNLSKTPPDRRSGKGDDEKRLFFVWTSGELQQLDRQLLSQADVPTNGRIVAQFIPPQTEQELARVELEHAHRQPKEIKRTVFGVRPQGGGFEFFVIQQEYRRN